MKYTINVPDNLDQKGYKIQIEYLEYMIADDVKRQAILGKRVKVLNVDGLADADWYVYGIGQEGVVDSWSKEHTGITLDNGKRIWLYPRNYKILKG